MSKLHWTERQRATARVGVQLRELGWLLWGFHEDKSDPMTDYFAPESWDGIATQDIDGERVVVGVDISGYTAKTRSGYTEEVTAQIDVGPCERCGGDGLDPESDGWTLGRARQSPREFHAWHTAFERGGTVKAADYRPGSTISLLMVTVELPNGETCQIGVGTPDVVSPLIFKDEQLRCRKCKGGGRTYRYERGEGPTWPEFHATPKGSTWHIERAGEIIHKGTGLAKAATWDQPGELAARELAVRIDSLARGLAAVPVEKLTVPTFRENREKNGLEVRFPMKPPEEIRMRLRGQGFRWSRRTRCWYRKATPEARTFAHRLVEELGGGGA